MEPIIILIGAIILTGIVGTTFLLSKAFEHPAAKHRKRMQKIVEGVGNAQEFAAAMAQQGRMKARAGRAATVAVVKRVGLEQAGYPHRCEYCGNPLYINQRECTGCGAPRK